MVDFQYRTAIDTYEQMNGRIKVLPVDIPASAVPRPAKPNPLERLLHALRATWMRAGTHTLADAKRYTGIPTK
jgi:hypothetical protein